MDRQTGKGWQRWWLSSDLLHLGDEVITDPGQLIVFFSLKEQRGGVGFLQNAPRKQ
jgi:hypothetical protein